MKFWRMTGLVAASPVDIILDKGNYTLEELLDEEEIIHEYRARNNRLITYLRNRAQVEQLLRYTVEEAPEGAEEKQIFKFPFIACELFICEVDVILNTLVEDGELMNMLFSFLKPDHPHNTLLAGNFGKIVMSLMLQKTAAVMGYIQNHQEIVRQLVDLIGITSIMEVLIRLIGADENIYVNHVDEMEWLKDTEVLEMIVDKFSSSDSPEVHANAAEVLCATIRYAPSGLAAKFCSSSFMGKLFRHALDGSRPKSVLVHSLTVCISLLDPKRLVSASYNMFRSHLTHGSLVAANPETIDEMLESLGDLLKLLDVSSASIFFPTTFGYLKPPFGNHRLKIVEFISVLLTIGSEAAERKLVQQGLIKHIVNMFFEYPFNNFLHRTVENIIKLCLESHSSVLIENLLHDCDIVNKILEAENQPLLLADCSKPTTGRRGRLAPRIGNFGHMTRIANKLIQAANSNDQIQTHLQENKEWVVWHANVLLKRNAVENVHRWACGRPNMLLDQLRDGNYDSFQDTNYEIVALANNLNPAFSLESSEEANVSRKPDDEDDESAEVKPSLHLAENPENISLFTNSSWFSYEENKDDKDPSAHLSIPVPSSDLVREEVTTGEDDNMIDSSSQREEIGSSIVENSPIQVSEDMKPFSLVNHGEEPTGSIEEMSSSDSNEAPKLESNGDELSSNEMTESNEENFHDVESENPSVDGSTQDFSNLPVQDAGSQGDDPMDESGGITADSSNAMTADECGDTLETDVVLGDGDHECGVTLETDVVVGDKDHEERLSENCSQMTDGRVS